MEGPTSSQAKGGALGKSVSDELLDGSVHMPANASNLDTEEAAPLPRNDATSLQEHADLIVQQIVFESVLKATQMPTSGHSPPSFCMITPNSSATSPLLDDVPSSSFTSQSMPAADDDDDEHFNPKAVLFANTNQTGNSTDSESGEQSSDCSLSVSTK